MDIEDLACVACTENGKSETIFGLMDMLNHIRRCYRHRVDLRHSNHLGEEDAHGHLWYCFSCEDKTGKDHRSFDSHQAMYDHLTAVHSITVLQGSYAIGCSRRRALGEDY